VFGWFFKFQDSGLLEILWPTLNQRQIPVSIFSISAKKFNDRISVKMSSPAGWIDVKRKVEQWNQLIKRLNSKCWCACLQTELVMWEQQFRIKTGILRISRLCKFRLQFVTYMFCAPLLKTAKENTANWLGWGLPRSAGDLAFDEFKFNGIKPLSSFISFVN